MLNELGLWMIFFQQHECFNVALVDAHVGWESESFLPER